MYVSFGCEKMWSRFTVVTNVSRVSGVENVRRVVGVGYVMLVYNISEIKVYLFEELVHRDSCYVSR